MADRLPVVDDVGGDVDGHVLVVLEALLVVARAGLEHVELPRARRLKLTKVNIL